MKRLGLALIMVWIQASLAFSGQTISGSKRPREETTPLSTTKSLRQTEIPEYFHELKLSKRAKWEDLPQDTLVLIGQFLDSVSLGEFSATHQEGLAAAKKIRQLPWKQELSEIRMIQLPAITEAALETLRKNDPKSLITESMSGFKVSSIPVSVGLYYRVMGHYPNLTLKPFISLSQYKAIWQIAEYHERWDANPEETLTITDPRENQEFIDRLNEKSGCHLALMSPEQEEYFRRVQLYGADHWNEESLPVEDEFSGAYAYSNAAELGSGFHWIENQ